MILIFFLFSGLTLLGSGLSSDLYQFDLVAKNLQQSSADHEEEPTGHKVNLEIDLINSSNNKSFISSSSAQFKYPYHLNLEPQSGPEKTPRPPAV